MIKKEGDNLKRVIVCSPESEYFRVENFKVHNITDIPDENRAREQHNELKAILEDFGSEVINIPELNNHPNSVFTRDTAVCTPEGYIELRMGLPSRRGEEDWMSEFLSSLGYHRAGTIEEPGTVEGGDVILRDRVAFIGKSRRTNKKGIKQISGLLKKMQYEIRVANVPSTYLHLGGAMSVLGRGYILCCKGVFPEDFFNGFKVIEVHSQTFVSGNVITLGNEEIIAEASNIEATQKLKQNGFTVHRIDLLEFIKGTGGPSCLIMPLERGQMKPQINTDKNTHHPKNRHRLTQISTD